MSSGFIPASSQELALLCDRLQSLCGARLQEVELSEHFLSLGFYNGGALEWLVMDLRSKTCALFLLNERPKVKLQKKPVSLFLTAHARDKRLVAVTQDMQLGRVLDFQFVNADGPRMQLMLIPSLLNVTVTAAGKSVALHKPRAITAHNKEVEGAARPPEQIYAEWSATKPKEKSAADPRAELIAKKQKAIAKVKEDLAKKSPQIYRQLGNELVTQQSMEVSQELRPLLEPTQNLAQNIERAFQKAKDLEQKRLRTEERLRGLEAELAQIQTQKLPAKKTASERAPIKSKAEYHARTLHLADDLEFQVGRSAKDNLALLRKSRAWDLWMHLKDEPGNHGILFRNKSKNIPDELLRKAAQFLVQAMGGPRAAKLKGSRVEMLVTECRFVRPIKGDRLGRVTHHNARTLTVLIG